MKFQSAILIHPGLNNSGTEHWQTKWEKKYPELHRVQQANWDKPICKDWIQQLDEEIMKYSPANVILVAHSLACTTVSYWAAYYKRQIKGALLVGPSDTEADSYPPGTTGFKPVPLLRLPFPSIVVMSANDPYVSIERAMLFAEKWGSDIVNIGNAGHINAAAGYGDWEEGLNYIKQLDQ